MNEISKLIGHKYILNELIYLEQIKKLPNKKVISSAKFEAKEQFTKSALENLKTENERLVNSLKKSGEIKESKKK